MAYTSGFVGPKISGARLFGRRVKRKAKTAVSSPYFQYGMPGAAFLTNVGANIWGRNLARKDISERRGIYLSKFGKDKKYITKKTSEEFAGRGMAGSTLHKEELAHRLRPIQTQEALIAQHRKSSKRRSLYNLLFG